MQTCKEHLISKEGNICLMDGGFNEGDQGRKKSQAYHLLLSLKVDIHSP